MQHSTVKVDSLAQTLKIFYSGQDCQLITRIHIGLFGYKYVSVIFALSSQLTQICEILYYHIAMTIHSYELRVSGLRGLAKFVEA